MALSPEYIFAGMMGAPDVRGFGVFWVLRDALAAACDMDGAFNSVALKLAPGASERAVVERLTTQLAPWGGREAHGRAQQPSHAMLDAEINEQRVLGTVLPSIFLGVAAFLLNVVVSLLVATQREQIAALKALGYPDRRIALHYLKLVLVLVLVLVIVAVGGACCWAMCWERCSPASTPNSSASPASATRSHPVLLSLGTAALDTLGATLATLRLAPAAPSRYRRTLFERLGISGLGLTPRMVLRRMERRPLRSEMSIAGVAAAVAIVVLGNCFGDAIDHIVDVQFNVAMRSDVIAWLAEPVDDQACHELARLPGVLAAGSGRDLPVRFVNGHLSERGQIRGLTRPPVLTRLIDRDNREASRLEDDSLVMTDRLADKLGLRMGQLVQVLEGRQRTLQLPLGATVAEVSGLLLGEMVDSIALPLGMLGGFGLVHLVTGLLKTDAFLFPVVIRAPTYAWAALVVLGAALASALVVRRHIDQLDMVAALKSRA